jgi:hypothetical protein
MHSIKDSFQRAHSLFNVRGLPNAQTSEDAEVARPRQGGAVATPVGPQGSPMSKLSNDSVKFRQHSVNVRDDHESLQDLELKKFEGRPDLWYDFKHIWQLLPGKKSKALRKSGRPDWLT